MPRGLPPNPKRSAKRGRRRGGRPLTAEEWRDLGARLALSGREIQVLQCVFDRQSTEAAAKTLRISPRTVQTHLQRMYRRLGVSSRAALVRRVIDAYLAPDRGAGGKFRLVR